MGVLLERLVWNSLDIFNLLTVSYPSEARPPTTLLCLLGNILCFLFDDLPSSRFVDISSKSLLMLHTQRCNSDSTIAVAAIVVASIAAALIVVASIFVAIIVVGVLDFPVLINYDVIDVLANRVPITN